MNTTTSVIVELISIANYFSKASYFKNFIETMDLLIKRNIKLEDNKSVILIDINGQYLRSKRTRYLHMRYFNIKDIVKPKKDNAC